MPGHGGVGRVWFVAAVCFLWRPGSACLSGMGRAGFLRISKPWLQLQLPRDVLYSQMASCPCQLSYHVISTEIDMS